MGRIKAGWWDCSSCGRRHISGPIVSCPGCGKPRGADVHFYMDDSSPLVTDGQEITRAKDGADWVCASCGRDNPAYKNSCNGCGTPHNQSTRRLRDELTVEPTGDTLQSLSERPPSLTYEPSGYGRTVQGSHRNTTNGFLNVLKEYGLTERFNLRSIGIGLGIIALILLCSFLTFQFFSVHPEDYSVSDFSWERTIDINQYRTLREEDWSVPSGGRLINSYQAIHHYVQVLDHYDQVETPYTVTECNGTETSCSWRDRGNGYFEEVCTSSPKCESVTKYKSERVARYRDDPVYATKYVYDIDRWVSNNRLVSTANDQNPFWPQTAVLTPPCATTVGNLCQGQRTERYGVTFTSSRDEKNLIIHKREQIPLEEWQSYQLNEAAVFSVNNFGMVTSSPTRIPK